MDNCNIVKLIDDIKNEVERRVDQYSEKSQGDEAVKPPEYLNEKDFFSIYYQDKKPFERVIAKIEL